jgi:hypothetical protein
MDSDVEPTSLNQLLDRLICAQGDDKITLAALLEAVGRRAFGPMLLVPGLLALSPLSGIPGMPSALGTIVMLVAGQLLLGRRHFWLPDVLLRREIARAKLKKAVRFLRPVARVTDRVLRRRLPAFTEGLGAYLIALVCFLTAATMPPLELLPFVASTAGAALTLFGLSLIAHDGLVALIALVLFVSAGVAAATAAL